jgi:hypothetical protein
MIAFANKPVMGFTESDFISAPNGGVAVIYPTNSDTVLSIAGDGSYQTRPKDAIGTNETFKKSGNFLVCVIPEGVFLIPFVEY